MNGMFKIMFLNDNEYVDIITRLPCVGCDSTVHVFSKVASIALNINKISIHENDINYWNISMKTAFKLSTKSFITMFKVV